jgi:VanZ family protein
MSLHRSSAWPLTWVAVALIAYASLYPLTGWSWPSPGVFGWWLPKQASEQTKDLVENLLGYMPLGAIWCLALLRSNWSVAPAAALALVCGSGLSYGMELMQFMLPMRTPSISDWTLNTLGTAWGVLAAITAHALGLVDVWHRWRERWFIPQAGFGLALMWLWPMGLLFPPPLPLAQGQLWPALHLQLVEWTANTPWQHWFVPTQDPLALFSPTGALPVFHLMSDPLRDAAIVALGLLAPMCVACAVARQKGLRIILLAGALAMGVAGTSFSTALNYGPDHLFTWISLPTVVGLLLGSVLGALLLGRTRTGAALIGLCVLALLVLMIHQVPPDPYYAQALEAWEHGRFIRLHGLSRWFGLLWPFAAFLWLASRVVNRAFDMPPSTKIKP